MKMKNRILKGLLIAGMLTSVTVMQAQDLPHDTLKVMYPGDSTVVEIPSSQDKYIEEKAILTPDDEGKLTSVLRKDSVGMVKNRDATGLSGALILSVLYGLHSSSLVLDRPTTVSTGNYQSSTEAL